VAAPATKAVTAPRAVAVAAEEKPTSAVPTLSQFGSVMVMVNGGTADVLVDGRNFGPAPQRVTLPVGQHTVAISVPGGGVSTAVPIKVDAGASSFITLNTGSH
jgi:archaellum component FlaF (FlaF/FlaG flagellin family)